MMKKPRSQIAVIITFVLAAIILFIVVFINISRVSTVKLSTSQAVDRAALGLASQIGSMSYYYKYKVLENKTLSDGNPGKCNNVLVALVIIAAASILAFFIKVPPTVILTAGSLAGAGALISMTMLGGIQNKLNEMTISNGAREAALFEALGSLQSDNVSLLPKGNGIFYDDINNNKSFETGEPEYNLSAIAGMLNQKTVGRFFAWYYAKRLPLVLEKDEALKNRTITFVTDLKDLVNDVGVWEASNKDASLKLKKLSYTIPPGTGLANFEITNETTWADLANERIRIVSIEENEKDAEGNYKATGGFLQEKLVSLATRLETAGYDLSFYTDAGDNEILKLMTDLTIFLARIKEILDMPRSPRLKNVMTWLSIFYNLDKHNPDRTSKDGNLEYDIYLRLTQDQNHINTWITELESKDALIRDIIDNANGHNEYGQGGTISRCYTAICHAESCSTYCCGSYAPCSFEGIYCTAWGGANPPVCVNGDLYGSKPGWCPLSNRSASCACSCSRSPQHSEQCNFQGQFSWRSASSAYLDSTSGPTEVEQAIRILRALNADITDIKKTIGDFAEEVKALTETSPFEPPDLRNKIVYAWKDAWRGEDDKQFSHLVCVEITDYPKKLPNIGEKIDWWTAEKCLVLQDYKGSFQITTSRYDQDIDITTPQWKLRRRKYGLFPDGGEFPPGYVADIVKDIQDNGKIDTYEEYVNSILYNFAITSQTKAYYGPEKSDIYIEKVK